MRPGTRFQYLTCFLSQSELERDQGARTLTSFKLKASLLPNIHIYIYIYIRIYMYIYLHTTEIGYLLRQYP